MTVRLIQGFAFPPEGLLNLLKVADIPAALSTSRGVPGKEMHDCMFSGMIFPDPTSTLGGFVGRMHDEGGESFLHAVVLRRRELAFLRKYLKDGKYDDTRFYFRRSGSLWVGDYQSEAGRGVAKCIVTVVPQEILRLKNRR